MTNNIDLNDTIVEKIGRTTQRKDRKGVIRLFGVFLVLVSSALIYYTASQTIHQTYDDTEKSLRSQVNILLQSRADIIDVWLDGVTSSAQRVSNADIFRLFATEFDQRNKQQAEKTSTPPAENETIEEGSDDEAASFQNDDIVTQIPYLNRLLEDFIKNSPFTKAMMVASDNKIILSSFDTDMALVSSREMARVTQAFESASPTYSSVREEGSEMIMDIYIPIFPPQSLDNQEPHPAALFVFTLPVRSKIATFLTLTDSKSLPGTLRLFQRASDGNFDEMRLSNTSLISASFFRQFIEDPKGIGFSIRQSIDNEEETVYTAAQSLKRIPWYIVWEVPTATALTEVYLKEKNITIVSLLAVFFIAASYTAFWWYSRNRFNLRMANLYQRLAKQIETQKWLLDSVNNSVAEAIGLKDDSGAYLYVNPAFPKLINKETHDIIGKTDTEIFGEIVAHRFEYWDKIALKSDAPVSSNEELYLGTKKRYLTVSKAPLKNNDVAENAIVTVISDNTALVEAQQARQHATEHTIVALSKTIEMRDPHLSGHSRRVAKLARVIAETLNLPHEDVTAIEMAGNLSQIGKIAIPRTILTKESRLTDQEIAIVQKHLDHAIAILKEVDFDIPVRETLYQMYERLDGEGYPKGLKGEEISLRARILGIADYFCARTEPRSYRSGISPEETLDILESMPDRYDAKVIHALRDLVKRPEFQYLFKSNK